MEPINNIPESLQDTISPKTYFWVKLFAWLTVTGLIVGGVLVAGVYLYFSKDLPDFRTLADYQPALITRIYDKDGHILAEYAKERRIYTPISDVPEGVIHAFLAAEDTGFFEHGGYDPKAILRAMLVNFFTDRKQGASTITQQVAKTFLLSSERTYTRKVKELILSRRIEKAFTKNEILELYLNQIYLGNGAYGITSAARAYFSKTLEDLTIEEKAMLAGLPKAPSRYNPAQNPQRAKARRDTIIRRMATEGFISALEADDAIAAPIQLNKAKVGSDIAPHFSEHIRRILLEQYGEKELYKGGLSVYTTLDSRMQEAAEAAVYRGVRTYDRRHGWRGALSKWVTVLGWQEKIKKESKIYKGYRRIGEIAIVLMVDDTKGEAKIGLKDRKEGVVPYRAVTWARAYIDVDSRGRKPRKISDVLSVGDLIMVKPLSQVSEEKNIMPNMYSLEQIPKVQAALISLDAKTGAVRAMVGGFGDFGHGFNRVIQGKRQVGSSFKPIVYSAALTKGMNPATTILDAPLVFRSGEKSWKPHNYSSKVFGPSTLRRGLEKSRNLMTIRLAREVGMRNIADMAYAFGLHQKINITDLTVALGSNTYSLWDMVQAYSVFANMGERVDGYVLTRVQNAVGDTIFRKHGLCETCLSAWNASPYEAPQAIKVERQSVLDPKVAYQMVSLLQGVIQRGSGRRARGMPRPVGGKTGTTNDYIDAWFTGFSPDLVTSVWVGFDSPVTLGKGDAGGKVASPIWADYMKEALKTTPKATFKVPEGITFVRVDAETGKLPSFTTKRTLLEPFIEGTEPVMETETPTQNLEQLPAYGIY